MEVALHSAHLDGERVTVSHMGGQRNILSKNSKFDF